MCCANFRKLLLGVLMFTFSAGISTQILAAPVKIDEIIPDEKFRYQIDYKDANADGYYSEEELHSITYLELDGENGVKSIKGLEYLTSLTHLFIKDVSLSGETLDLSKHTALRFLELSGNGLSGLNVSGCANLETVTIEKENIGSIDLSGKKKLWELEIEDTSVTNLNLSGCSHKMEVEVECPSLTNVDLTGCSGITRLFLKSENLTKLRLSDLSSLSSLTLSECEKMKSLDISKNTKLTELGLYDLGSLTKLNTSKNKKLEHLFIENCFELSGIDFRNNSINSLYLSQCGEFPGIIKAGQANIKSLTVEKCTLPSTLKMSKFKGLKYLQLRSCKGGSTVDLSSNTVHDLDITSNSVKKLTLKLPATIKEDGALLLMCGSLTELKISGLAKLTGASEDSGSVLEEEELAEPDDSYSGALDGCKKLKKLTLLGKAPAIAENAFEQLNGLTVFYPYNDKSWASVIGKDYGGKKISWQGIDPSTGSTVKGTDAKKAGDILKDTSSNGKYKINKDGKTATFTGMISKNKTSLVIPQKIKHGLQTFKVTAIAAAACKGNKKLKSVDLPKTLKSIGKQAFNGCKNLKKIIIRTSALTSKSVGKQSFKGTNGKPTVTVPKKKLKAYKKLLTSAGISKKAVYKVF